MVSVDSVGQCVYFCISFPHVSKVIVRKVVPRNRMGNKWNKLILSITDLKTQKKQSFNPNT